MFTVKLHLLTKYLLNINLTGVTYEIIRIAKEVDLFENSLESF